MDLAIVDGTVQPASAATIGITDEGLLRGDGVFEVIRVYRGVAFALDEHVSASGLLLEESHSASRDLRHGRQA